MVSYETQKDHAIKLSLLPTRPALYEDKDVLAAQPWFSHLLPVLQTAVARPSTVTGASYNKVSAAFFQTTNQILTGGISVDQGISTVESKIQAYLR
jgi:trehalose/maltose transport system substrate-binding protein